MNSFTYEEAKRYALELPLHTKKNPFEVAKAFYEWLGEPGKGCPTIHVAGTNGKGSVCAYLNSILSTAGYRVGMFTSPHLVDIRERFVLENAQIGEARFAQIFNLLQKKLKEYAKESGTGHNAVSVSAALTQEAGKEESVYRPTFFETMFFLFMLWMEEEKPDCILLETGMGGRLDVTNVIERPAVTVITRIGLDHCEYLGDTVEKIAREKVCIFKEKIPAVCLETDDAVTRVFVEKAQNLSIPLVMVSKNEVSLSKLKKNNIDFFLESAYDRDIEAHLETIAIYQAENAALAVRALEQTGNLFRISAVQIEEGLSRMHWGARMEEVMPGVYLDGAHNPDGIFAFLRTVEQDGFSGERWLLFGACADKSVQEMASMLQRSGLFDRIMGVRIRNRRSLTGGELRALFAAGQPELEAVFEDAACAFIHMTRQKGEKVRIYIAGSLYLAGEVKQCLEDMALGCES